jgi:hypothetical protein
MSLDLIEQLPTEIVLFEQMGGSGTTTIAILRMRPASAPTRACKQSDRVLFGS